VGKSCPDGKSPGEKPYTAERIRISFVDGNSESFERCKAIGHQAFTARFVDRHAGAIRYDHVKSLLSSGDGCRQSCRTTTNHKHISRIQQLRTSPF
jgi:hypothetical protein